MTCSATSPRSPTHDSASADGIQAAVLAFAVAAVLAGATSLAAIGEWAARVQAHPTGRAGPDHSDLASALDAYDDQLAARIDSG